MTRHRRISRRIPRPLWRVSIRQREEGGDRVIRDNHLFQIHGPCSGKGWAFGVRQEEHSRTNLPPPLVDKLPDRALSFITHSTLSFPSFLLVPWLPSSRLSRGRSSRLRITLPPLLLLAAAPLLLEVSLIPRRINATRPGWITTTINFIERTISYGGYRARRERNLRDTWRDKGGGGGGGSYLASKTAREDIAWNLGENWVDRFVLEFWTFAVLLSKLLLRYASIRS